MLYARPGIYLLSGDAYEGAVIPMQIIMPTLFFIGLTNVFGIQMLVPLGGERFVLYSEIAGALCDLIINWLLIPRYASSGAAIGTVAAEAVVLIVQVIALRQELAFMKKMPYVKVGAGALLAVCASFWVLRLSVGSFLKLLIGSMCFFGVYGGVLLILGEPMTREILQMLIQRVRNVNR
jgi:O-antigen/teichoic acid export membrane protein